MSANDIEWIEGVQEIRSECKVGKSLATELLVLAGGDVDLVIESSKAAAGLSQCKAAIIDGRFDRIEQELYYEEEDD